MRSEVSSHWGIVGSGLILAGIIHLLVPQLLLRLAQKGYKHVLAIDVQPRAPTTRRIRLIGIGMILTGFHVLYYRGIIPDSARLSC